MNSAWPQHYQILGLNLGLSSIVAAAPIFTLLFFLGVRRKPAWTAALAGLFASLLVAIVAYRMPATVASSAVLHGAAFGLFPISWIVFAAILLYKLTVHTGRFRIIKDSLGTLTPDPRLQALLIAFCFGAFIEGAAGFGTPVAVAAAMLIGFGFSPFYASAICLLANTAPVAFGSIGIPVITLAGITGLPLLNLSAAVGRLCAPLSLIIPGYLIAVISGRSGLAQLWPATLLCGATFGGVQFLVSNFIGPQLTDILSSLSSIVALLLYLHFSKASTITDAERLALLKNDENGRSFANTPEHHSVSTIIGAWAPYAILVACVLAWGLKPVQTMLNSASMVFPWPFLHNQVLRTAPIVSASSPYPAMFSFNWLSASGTSCMVATILSAIVLRVSIRDFFMLLGDTARQLILPTITVASVLGMAFLMNYSGATGTLGLAFSATGALFPFFSSLLGWLGVFLTGSDTSANALFGGLQVVTAQRLGFDPVLIAASNSAGGVMGKMISLQTISVAAAATGMSVADQGKLFRFTLKHSIILATLVGIEVLIYAYGSAYAARFR